MPPDIDDTQEIDIPMLHPADRCDRCSAQGRVLLRLDGADAAELVFCRHHWVEHSLTLTTAGWRIMDDSLDELEHQPGASA